MSPNQLRVSIALAHAVPGAALRICSRDGGALIASDHPAAELGIDELRTTIVASDADGQLRVDQLIAEAEVGGSLVPLGAGVYLYEEGGRPSLWSAVPLLPSEIGAALDAVECPPAPACIEVILRPDPELGATSICVTSVLDIDDDELVDVALHILGACLASEAELAVSDRPRR